MLIENLRVAKLLERVAEGIERNAALDPGDAGAVATLLSARAWRDAARMVSCLGEGVQALISRGGVDQLPGIGPGIAAAIVEAAASGRIERLDAAVSRG